MILRFDNINNELYGLIRRERKKSLIGKYNMQLKDWTWNILPYMKTGGPNFLIYKNQLVISSRVVENNKQSTRIYVYNIERNNIVDELILPSGGDTGYPGMFIEDDILYLSYYSSHEGSSNIYVAKIEINL